MKPGMKRLLRNVPMALALVVILALAGLWVRSRRIHDSMAFERRDRVYIVCSLRGRIGVVVRDQSWNLHGVYWGMYRVGEVPGNGGVIDAAEKHADTIHVMGVLAGEGKLGSFGDARWLAMPYWIPMLILSPLVFAPLTHFVRRVRRIRRGLCVRCGYDLRASPTQCPECGFSMA